MDFDPGTYRLDDLVVEIATSCDHHSSRLLISRSASSDESMTIGDISEAVLKAYYTVSKKMFLFYILNWLNGAFNHLPR